MTSRTVAAFDMDGTLTRRDTLLPFLVDLVGWRRLALLALRQSPSLALAVSGLRDRGLAKEQLLSHVLAGRRSSEIARAGEHFADSHRYVLRQEVVDLLRWHVERGDEVVVVSASLEVVVRPLVRRLGVDNVSATELEAVNGVLTGRFAGRNVRGGEKLVRLRRLLGADTERLIVYGDSEGDRDLLDAAHHAIWCGSARRCKPDHLPLMPPAVLEAVLLGREDSHDAGPNTVTGRSSGQAGSSYRTSHRRSRRSRSS